MRIFALTVATLATIAVASAVEYIGGETFTFEDGTQKTGVFLPEYGVLAIWTSKGTTTGPVYGLSLLRRSDVKDRKAQKGIIPPQAYPVHGSVFEPDAETLLSGADASRVFEAVGLATDKAGQATQARATLAEIKAAAMKKIKP